MLPYEDSPFDNIFHVGILGLIRPNGVAFSDYSIIYITFM